jgi:hypothetical protein
MKTFLLYICFILVGFTVAAQTPEEQLNPKKQEKIKALYVAYISQQLNFTPDEAQKFWPVHAQYDAELRAINTNNADELTRQQAVLNVKKKYQANFSKVLGTDRCNNFYKQDAEFRKKMLDRLKQMRQKRNEIGNNPKGNIRGGGGMRGNMQNPN